MAAYNGEFLWPPRPETAVHSIMLQTFDSRSAPWIAQAKKNGQCVLAVVHRGGALQLWDRHMAPLKWSPASSLADRVVRAISPKLRPAAAVAELVHAKVPGIRDVLYFHDVLAHDGELLVGRTLEERQKLLVRLMPGGAQHLTHFDLGGGLWRTRNMLGCAKAYKLIVANAAPEDEGIVLKDPASRLEPMLRQKSNAGWQVKSLRPTKNRLSGF